MKDKWYFRKLYHTSLLTIALGILMVFLLLCVTSYRFMMYELSKKDASYLTQIATSVDFKIKTALNTVNRMKVNRDFNELLNKPECDYYLLSNVQKGLMTYNVESPDLNGDVYVYLYDFDLLASGQQTFGLQSFLSFNKSTMTVEQLKIAAQEKSSASFRLLPVEQEGRGKFIAFLPDTVDGKKVLFFIEFDLKNMLPYTETGEVMLLKDAQLYGRGENFYSAEKERVLASELKQADMKNNPVKYDGKHFYYTKTASIENLYVLYGETYHIFQPFVSRLVIYLLVMFVLTAVAAYFSLFLTKRIYRPIQSILDTIGPDESIDDLGAIRESIRGLKETNINLKNQIDDQRVLTRSRFFNDCILGLIHKEDAINSAKRMGIKFEAPFYILLVEPATIGRRDQIWFYHEAEAQVINLMKEYLKSYFPLDEIRLGDGRILLILENSDENAIRQQCSAILALMENDYDKRYVAAILQLSSVAELAEGYRTLKMILEKRVIGDGRVIYDKNDLEQQKSTYYYPIEVEQELIGAVLSGDWHNCENVLDGIMRENFVNRTLSRDDVSELIYVMVVTIKRTFQKINTRSEEVFPDGDFTYVALKLYPSVEQLAANIKDLFRRFCVYVQDKSESAVNSIALEMCEYVKENYNTDLSLADLAERFNLSVNYISRAFKKYTGDNFKDYLNRLRVKKATEILESQRVTINEIAEMVGCNSTTTFIRIYKRYKGESPGKLLKR